MNVVLSIRRFVSWRAVVAAWLAVSTVANATSIYFPKFSKPVLKEERLVFTSPDSKRLLCVTITGEKLWEKSHAYPVDLIAGRDSEPLLQTGKVVSVISLRTGELKPQFALESKNDKVSYSQILNEFISTDRRFKERNFKILDEKTGGLLWRGTEVERILGATPEMIVAACAKRIPNSKGYTFGQAFICAFDRERFERKWRIPVSGDPWRPAAFKAPFLIYADGESSLAVVDCTSGRKLLSKQMELPKYGRIVDIKIQGDYVAWLTDKMNFKDFNRTEHPIHFCTIPELAEENAISLTLIEIAKISFEGGFIISDALYRTACFRQNGEKVWERFQSERTPVIQNRLYFSDYATNKTTRIGVVEVASGKETILYTESVKQQ